MRNAKFEVMVDFRHSVDADFNAKMNIALKEANESFYWLRLLHETEYPTDKEFGSMEADIKEIISSLFCFRNICTYACTATEQLL